ncbi:MAG: hypothetical protein AAGD96_00925, partial [Chloroflexota bacterium]
GNRPIKASYCIATFSYSMYLIHKIVNHLVNTWLSWDAISLFLLSIILTVVAGGLMYLLIERPFLQLKRSR